MKTPDLSKFEKIIEEIDTQLKSLNRKREKVLQDAWEESILPKMNDMVGHYYESEENSYQGKFTSYHKVIGASAEKRKLWVESFKTIPPSMNNGGSTRFEVEMVKPNRFWDKGSKYKETTKENFYKARAETIKGLNDIPSETMMIEGADEYLGPVCDGGRERTSAEKIANEVLGIGEPMEIGKDCSD